MRKITVTALLIAITAISTAFCLDRTELAKTVIPYYAQWLNPLNPQQAKPIVPVYEGDRDRDWRLSEVQHITYETPNGTMQPYIKLVPYYNINYITRIDSFRTLVRDLETNVWTHELSTVYRYTPSEEHIYQMKVYQPGLTIPILVTQCAFDSQQRVTTIVTNELVNHETGQYQVINRQYYTYGGINLYEVGNTYIDANQQHSYQKVMRMPDSNGRATMLIGHTSPDSVTWTQVSYDNFTYHANDTSTGAQYNHYLGTKMLSDIMGLPAYFGMPSIVYYRHGCDGVNYSDFKKYYYYYYDDNSLVQIIAESQLEIYDFRYVYYYDIYNNLSNYTIEDWNAGFNSWENLRTISVFLWQQDTSTEDETMPVSEPLFSIYPNPFKETLSIRFNKVSDAPVKIQVYNTRGQKVKEFTTDEKSAG
jgi:hypothetical protein